MNIHHIYDKILVDKKQIQQKIAIQRFLDKKIVFTNGCFDIMHLGHLEYLAKASGHGDFLIVGLNSDISVKTIKGEYRPVQDEKSRSLLLASLVFVDLVVIFEEPTPYEIIKTIEPDVLIKGSDYDPGHIIGADIVENKGGKVLTVELTEGYSTSGIIQKIKNT